MTSGNMKISAVNLQKSVLKGRVWSCSGKLSSVTREALISNIHRASAKCTCSAWTNYARVGTIPSASFAPAQMQALQPLWPPRASSTHQTPLSVPARGLVAAAAVSASQLLLPAATLPVPTATLARALWREGDPMARMLLECSRSCQLWHLKDRDTPKLPLVAFHCQSYIPESFSSQYPE